MLAWGDLEPPYPCVNFFLPVNSVSWWQVVFEWGGDECCLRIFIVHYEYAPQGQTIAKDYYRDVPHRLHDAVNRQLVPSRQCSSTFLTLDSDIFGKNQTPVVHQASSSPDMALGDFWHFSKLKRPLKGKSDKRTKHYLTQMLLAIN